MTDTMTLDSFLDEFEAMAAGQDWSVSRRGPVRRRLHTGDFCPITALAKHKGIKAPYRPGDFRLTDAHGAGTALGMGFADIETVVHAADHATSLSGVWHFPPEIRERLLRAVGHEE